MAHDSGPGARETEPLMSRQEVIDRSYGGDSALAWFPGIVYRGVE